MILKTQFLEIHKSSPNFDKSTKTQNILMQETNLFDHILSNQSLLIMCNKSPVSKLINYYSYYFGIT